MKYQVGYNELINYPQYDGGISANTMVWNGEEQPWQFIVRQGKPIAVFTSAYKLIPNDQAIEVANDMAKRAGLVTPSKMSKEAFYIPPADIMWSKDELAFTALFIDPKPHNIAPTGQKEDTVFKGLAVKGSTNGWSAMSASSFVFKKICQNMNLHFRSSRMLQETNIEIKDISSVPTNAESRMKLLESIKLIHRQSLDTTKIADSIAEVLESGDQILERYQQMETEKLLQVQAEKLKKLVQLPKAVTNELSWLHLDKDKVSGNIKASFDDVTTAKAYQDITEILTHRSPKLGFYSKMSIYNKIDMILVQK